MLLSEKEMAQILTETLEAAVVTLTAVPTARILNIGNAAHAIHQRQAGGVAWEGGAVVKHESRWENGELVICATLHFDEIAPGWLLNMPDGQRVEVTVSKADEGVGDATE